MADKDYVEQAYAATVQGAFKALFDSILEANGDAGKEDAAVGRFKLLLALARRTRDKATAAL